MRRHRLALTLLASFAFMGLFVGCTGDDGNEVSAGDSTPETAPSTEPLPAIEGTPSEQLAAARARWEAAGIDSYEMTWSKMCFCPQESGGSRVIDGEVVEVWQDGHDDAAPPTTHPTTVPQDTRPSNGASPTTTVSPATMAPDPGQVPGDDTRVQPATEPAASPYPRENLNVVEGFFAVIEQAVDGDADEVDVTYDLETGRPISIDIDWMAAAIDDEMGYSIDSFEVLDDAGPDPSNPNITAAPTTGTSLAPSVREVLEAELDVNHGCGIGLFVGNDDQTVALRLSWKGGELPLVYSGLNETASFTLPGEGWDGEILIGTDLYANWCDDVLEPGEPPRRSTSGGAWSAVSWTSRAWPGGTRAARPSQAPSPISSCGRPTAPPSPSRRWSCSTTPGDAWPAELAPAARAVSGRAVRQTGGTSAQTIQTGMESTWRARPPRRCLRHGGSGRHR